MTSISTAYRQTACCTVLSRSVAGRVWPLALLLASCGGGSSSSSSGIDPLVEDFGIAYVRQPVPEEDTEDLRQPESFEPGADLIYRDLAAPDAREINVTERVTGGMGDVRDVEVSYDGSRLLFALHLPEIEGAAPEDQPTWNLWEYAIASDTLSRVIESDIIAEDGQDIAPHYLPDGRIVFSSNRQRASKALLIDESKPPFSTLVEGRQDTAFVLHVLDARQGSVETSDIQQISFNQSHDLDPTLLSDGEILFSRWDNTGSRDGINLYKMYPDGTKLRLVYGANSHATGSDDGIIEFTESRETEDQGIMALIRPSSGNFQGGDIITIDVDNYLDNAQPTAVNNGILTGPAQVSASFGDIRTDELPSPAGRINSYYPLWDGTNRILITWSQCRLLSDNRILPCTEELLADPDATQADPLYSAYLYDPSSQTQLPIFTPQEGLLYRDIVAAQPRPLPQIHFEGQGPATADYDFDPALVSEGVGLLDIRSVYDFDGSFNPLGSTAPDIAALADPALTTSAALRPARFLRIVKAVSIPDDELVDLQGSDFGISSQQGMREIIGYAPIEPDGSVRVKVPANIPFAISVLDGDGKRISERHQSWLQLRSGEIMSCAGCHASAGDTSHGRYDAFTPLYAGAPFNGYTFPNTEIFFADAGDTMAQARTRIDPTALDLSVDIHYQDVWTDEIAAGRLKDPDMEYRYADLDSTLTAPTSAACQTNWQPLCRIVINYETHIHPLWSLQRGALGADTCINCHSSEDAMLMVPRVPDGQLDLTDGASDLNADHFKAYRELVSNDFEQVIDIDTGLLVDREEQATDGMGNPLFELDANGNQILDGAGDPIPVLIRFPVTRSMSIAGAAASDRFFDMFSNAADPRNTVTNHVGFLSSAELKLLAEWLDIGGQYYNNPFDVPP
jgi:hypothetical protein